jgi:aryl-alcohol dehydrogenase-like predicted oxidoreductase
MEKRRLGQSDLSLAPLMLGGNVFGWTIDQRTSFGILDAFIDAGFNAVDTSDSYARWVPGSPGGESETIIGNWLKRSGKRDKVLIATKVGEDMGEGRCLKKDYILREREASLRDCRSITSIYTTPISTTRSRRRKRRCRPTRNSSPPARSAGY